MSRRRTALAIVPVLVAAIATALAAPLSANDHIPTRERPSIEQLVAYFDTVAFGSEFAGIEAAPTVRKWQLPLRVVVREYNEVVTVTSGGREIRRLEAMPVQSKHVAYVQKHLNTLAVLSGLKTQDAKKTRWPPNFTIKFVPPLQLTNPQLANVEPGIIKRLGAQGGCYFVTWTDEEGINLRDAVIVINKARPAEKTDHCVLEEMTQSLGLPNDTTPPWPSIFSNTGTVKELSWVDNVMVKTLYDARMKPGMSRADALITARRVISEIINR